MSHATGYVFLDTPASVQVGWFEYNGTSDVAIPMIYESAAELQENWRRGTWRVCNCGHAPTLVILRTDYGGGFEWHGTACFHCMVIVDGEDPYAESSYMHNRLTDD